jgi:hypothetical protein
MEWIGMEWIHEQILLRRGQAPLGLAQGENGTEMKFMGVGQEWGMASEDRFGMR